MTPNEVAFAVVVSGALAVGAMKMVIWAANIASGPKKTGRSENTGSQRTGAGEKPGHGR